MPVLFRKYDVEEVVRPERLGVIYPKLEQTRFPGRFGLVFEGIGEDASSNPHHQMPVLDPKPGKAVCVSTEISEREGRPDTLVACRFLHVEVAFILSRAGGCVRHHATVMQNVIGPATSGVRSSTRLRSGGSTTRALKARLNAIEKQLRLLDFNGLRLPRIVNAVRNDVWHYDHSPGGNQDASYSVKVSYMN
jgi:hypothetical protein